MDVRLLSVRFAADGVSLFELAALDGRPLTAVAPGSHLRLELPNGLVRPYFIAERSRRGTYVIGVRRDPDGRGSKYLHDKVRVGATLRIAGGAPAPRSTPIDGRRTLLLAEDIGVFHAWPILRALDARGATWELYYDAWSRTGAPLLNELRAYGSRVRVHVRSEAQGRPLDWRGLTTQIAANAGGLRGDCVIDACGSQEMWRALDAARSSTPSEQLPRVCFTPISEAPAPGPIEFEVVLGRSGTTVPVHAGETILEALRGAKVEVRSFCAAGICGTCRTRVLEGVPRHQDAVLSAAERASNAVMMICRSRAETSRLVLDL